MDKRLDADAVPRSATVRSYDEFLADYTTRLVAALGDSRPYFYTFKRVLIWGNEVSKTRSRLSVICNRRRLST